MRKVIGIGETVLDILFENNQPVKAVPGGSVFNAMITLSRLGIECLFISELGNDHVGDSIVSFMEQNNLSTKHLCRFSDGKSPLALAFLNEKKEASYSFYTSFPSNRLDIVWPRINKDDILLVGSYFSINPDLRPRIIEFLEYAQECKAIIYYDPNFRKPHRHQALRLMPSIIENLEYANIVRGSIEDFDNLYNLTDPYKIYKEKIAFYSSIFICTSGEKGTDIFTRNCVTHIDAPKVEVVSTIGAGDNFNAGIIYGLINNNITQSMISNLSPKEWNVILQSAIDFASEVCTINDNYISQKFAKNYILNSFRTKEI